MSFSVYRLLSSPYDSSILADGLDSTMLLTSWWSLDCHCSFDFFDLSNRPFAPSIQCMMGAFLYSRIPPHHTLDSPTLPTLNLPHHLNCTTHSRRYQTFKHPCQYRGGNQNMRFRCIRGIDQFHRQYICRDFDVYECEFSASPAQVELIMYPLIAVINDI